MSGQTESTDASEDATCRAILAYLREHPDAQDTARGVAEWWLAEQGLRRRPADAERALERLVQRGWVREWSAPDGRRHYRLSPARLEEVRRRLEERED